MIWCVYNWKLSPIYRFQLTAREKCEPCMKSLSFLWKVTRNPNWKPAVSASFQGHARMGKLPRPKFSIRLLFLIGFYLFQMYNIYPILSSIIILESIYNRSHLHSTSKEHLMMKHFNISKWLARNVLFFGILMSYNSTCIKIL